MVSRRSGRGYGCEFRQPLNQWGNREPAAEQNRDPWVNPTAQITTAIQRMIDLLIQIVDRQGHNPGNHVEREDSDLE